MGSNSEYLASVEERLQRLEPPPGSSFEKAAILRNDQLIMLSGALSLSTGEKKLLRSLCGRLSSAVWYGRVDSFTLITTQDFIAKLLSKRHLDEVTSF